MMGKVGTSKVGIRSHRLSIDIKPQEHRMIKLASALCVLSYEAAEHHPDRSVNFPWMIAARELLQLKLVREQQRFIESLGEEEEDGALDVIHSPYRVASRVFGQLFK